MELKNLNAKYDLAVSLVIKSDLVKKAKDMGLDIDEALDNYIYDNKNIEMIHELIEKSIYCDLDISEIEFDEDETLIDTYGDYSLYVTADCTVTVEALFSEKSDWEAIQNRFDDVDFYTSEDNVSINSVELKDII